MQLQLLKREHGLPGNCLVILAMAAGLGLQTPVSAADGLPAPSPAPAFRHQQLNSRQIDDLLRQGMASECRGQTTQAESIFHQVLALDPHNANAYFNLGVLEEKKGNLQGASYHYHQAAQIQPQEADFQQAIVSVEAAMSRNIPVLTVHNGPAPEMAQSAPRHPLSRVQMNQPDPPVVIKPTSCEKPAASKRSRITKAVMGAAFAVGVSAAIGAASGRGMGGLHCPMCRVLRGGF